MASHSNRTTINDVEIEPARCWPPFNKPNANRYVFRRIGDGPTEQKRGRCRNGHRCSYLGSCPPILASLKYQYRGLLMSATACNRPRDGQAWRFLISRNCPFRASVGAEHGVDRRPFLPCDPEVMTKNISTACAESCTACSAHHFSFLQRGLR